MIYRFPKWKDASWNSFERQKERYEIIRPFLGRGQVGAEIGVYKGGFGEFLLEHCRKLYLVDPWYRAGAFWSTGLPNDSRVDSVINILSIYKKEIESGQVEIVVDFSHAFFDNLDGILLDFVYIDASHEYHKTLSELQMAHRNLKKGGRLFGDDYDPDPASKQHGVCRAVEQFMKDSGARMILNHSRQWGLSFPE